MRRVVAFAAIAALLPLRAVSAAPEHTTFTSYVTMPDGVRIAVAVDLPGPPTRHYPTLFQMDGYKGGGSTSGSNSFEYDADRYAMVTASVRGTGCSGGRFDLFDPQTARDGHHVIERWLVRQRWSNGRVGIVGHSYPGITGFAIAATNPPHVRAVAVSGLMSDTYRDTYFGGVPNQGFPLLWAGGIRPASEIEGNVGRLADDPACAANIASRPPPYPFASELVLGSYPFDYEWYRTRSLARVAPDMRIPIHITAEYQDEQVGRRAPLLWQLIRDGVPKRLILSNGYHATATLFGRDRQHWLDCLLLRGGRGCAAELVDRSQRVRMHFGTTRDAAGPSVRTRNYPADRTRWRRLYLRSSGALSTRPARSDQPRSYVAASQGRSVMPAASSLNGVEPVPVTEVDRATAATATSGPDTVEYDLRSTEPLVVAGPILADLWMTSTAIDTDVDIRIIDRAPDGTEAVLQFGMLRASLRAVDESRSWRVTKGPMRGTMYRPYLPYDNPVPLKPGEPTRLRIEIYPIGAVIAPGHSLVVRIGTPPTLDQYAQFASGQPPAVNQVLHDSRHPSSVLIPTLDAPRVEGGASACADTVGAYCVPPPN